MMLEESREVEKWRGEGYVKMKRIKREVVEDVGNEEKVKGLGCLRWKERLKAWCMSRSLDFKGECRVYTEFNFCSLV